MIKTFLGWFPGTGLVEQAQVAAAFGTWVACGVALLAVVAAIYLAWKGIRPNVIFVAKLKKRNFFKRNSKTDGYYRYTDNPESNWEKVIYLSVTNLNTPLIEIDCIRIRQRFSGNNLETNIDIPQKGCIEKNDRKILKIGQTFIHAVNLEDFCKRLVQFLRQKGDIGKDCNKAINIGEIFVHAINLKGFCQELVQFLRQKRKFSPRLELYLCVELKNGKKLKARLPEEVIQVLEQAIAADQ